MAVLGSQKNSRVAVFFAIALLATVLVPLNMVSADAHSHANGFIVVFEPEGGDLDDGKLFVDATSGVYTFHVSVYDATGAPAAIGSYGLVALGMDAVTASLDNTDLCSTSGHPQCMYVSGGRADASTFTVKIPVTQVALFGQIPANGIGLFVILHTDANGVSLADPVDGTLPTGYYNPATATAFAAGNYAEADELDHQAFPILLRNAFLEDLVQPGNAVLNPGFEYSAGVLAAGDIGAQVENYGFSTEMAPWFLFVDAGPGASSEPASDHFLATNCGAPGEAGSCASIHVDLADAGKNLMFGQFFAPPGSGVGVWRASETLTLAFDTRTNHDYPWQAHTTVHYLDANGVEQQVTRSHGSAIPGGYEWTSVSLDFSDIPPGSILTSFFFSLNQAWTSNPIVLFDNVQLSGATLVPTANLANNLNDGHSAFILPLGGSASPTGVLSQDLVSLNGDAYFVYEVAAEDYTTGGTLGVDVNDARTFVFQLLDEQYLVNGLGHENALYTQTDGQFRLLDENGNVTRTAYVLVPADAVGESARVVPWVYKDIATGDTYENTFGTQSEPVSSYHSLLRNGLRGNAAADHLDYAFTPVVLSDTIGSSLVGTTTLTLACDGVVPGQACLNDPTPLMRADFSTTSRVLETVTIELVPESRPDLVLVSGSLQVPSGTIEFELSEESMDLLRAEAPDLRVLARTSGALFTGAAESGVIRLDNIIPIADFRITPPTGATALTTIAVQDASSDADGTVERRAWQVTFVRDDTPDEDATIEGSTIVSHAGATNLKSFSFSVPDDGVYQVSLLAEDNDGGYTTKVLEFEVVNLAPTAALAAPAFIQPNLVAEFDATFADADGILKPDTTTWTVSDPLNTTIVQTVDGAVLTFAADGVHTVSVSIQDDDGAVGIASATIIVDGNGPTTGLSIPAAPSSGWFQAPVHVTVSRADDLSGVARTRLDVDGVGVITTVGEDEYVRRVATEGRHVVTAFSTDRAGNVGEAAQVGFNIDTSAPTVELTTESNVPALPFSVHQKGAEVTLSANALDRASGVQSVSFYREDVLIGTDTDGTDGWSIVWDTTSDVGTWDVQAIATDVAGHAGKSDTMRYFILDI